MQYPSILLIGAGPIGIELAVALKREGFPYIHVEAGCIGATIQWYAPGTQFFSSSERIQIAGVPLGNASQQKATREEYLLYLRQVVRQFQLSIDTFQRVTKIQKIQQQFVAEIANRTGEARSVRVDIVILAIGDMHRPIELGIPGERQPHVSHYLRDPHDYSGQRVLVVGGKNSAVEAAIRLYRIGASVSLSYRRAEFDRNRIKYWLLPELLHLVKSGSIRFFPQSEIAEIRLGEVTLNSNISDSNEKSTMIQADAVLLLTGYQQDKTLFRELGVTLEGAGEKPRHNKLTMETDVAGVFVCGTAAAGTQLEGVKEFIETSHIHVDRIIAALRGEDPPSVDSIADLSLLER